MKKKKEKGQEGRKEGRNEPELDEEGGAFGTRRHL
jgi:hypothetical protein